MVEIVENSVWAWLDTWNLRVAILADEMRSGLETPSFGKNAGKLVVCRGFLKKTGGQGIAADRR